MLFNSLVFVLFFAVVYSAYRALPHRGQNALLLLASWFFYAWWDWRFLSLLLLSTAVDWAVGRALATATRHRRLLLLASIVVNLGILGTFKYLGFFTVQANALLEAVGVHSALPVLHLVLPVGLSFYTFQSMAYTIDVYRGRLAPTRSFWLFALFVSFFPQLVAGPIERSTALLPQLERPRTVSREQLALGAQLVLLGYFKKVFVADNLGVIVSQVFDSGQPTHGLAVLLAGYAFTWQIYGDFSGYTDVARGLARWMGIELSLNFNLPFFATGPRDLWRRWHISLSQWLRDYLYIPLGGSRHGSARTHLNLVATMVLGGLWHGASWTFVVWGAVHGLALVIQRLLQGLLPPWPSGRLGRLLAIVLTFHFTAFCFLIFRAHDLHQVGYLLQNVGYSLRPQPGDLDTARQLAAVVGPLFALELAQYLSGDLQLLARLPRPVQAGLVMAATLVIVILGASYGRRFIYFQF